MRRGHDYDVFDSLLIAFALALVGIVLYYAAERWPRRFSVISPGPIAPARAPAARGHELAAAKAPQPPGVSRSFRAVDSIPPIAISRTGRPSFRTKAPPSPKSNPDQR